MYPYNYIKGFYPNYRGNVSNKMNNIEEDRNLLLPLLFGAAVGFPLGYIVSNKNQNYPIYQQPYYPQPMPYQQPYYPQPMPYQQPVYYNYY